MALFLRPDDIIEPYTLKEKIGTGGFAQVWRAEHNVLKRNVAIKILETPLSNDKEKEVYLQEAQTTANLTHPNIVKLIECSIYQNHLYLVLVYATNGTLRKRYPRGTRVPLSAVVTYVEQIASALQYAHNKRLIHRDVKPGNLLLGPENQVWLSDFGIAKVADSMRAEQSMNLVGTPEYMAPEQFTPQGAVAASDQYALATIVYEWLTGSLPYDGKGIASISKQQPPPALRSKAPDISPAVEQVVLKALSLHVADRYKNVSDFSYALKEAAKSPIRPTTPRSSAQDKTVYKDDVAAPIAPFPPKQPASNPQIDNVGFPIAPTPSEERHTPPSVPISPDVPFPPRKPAATPPLPVHDDPYKAKQEAAQNHTNENKGGPFIPPKQPDGTPRWNVPQPPPTPSPFHDNPTSKTKAEQQEQMILPTVPVRPTPAPHSRPLPTRSSQRPKRAFDFKLHNRPGELLFLLGGAVVDIVASLMILRWLQDGNIATFSVVAVLAVRLLCSFSLRRYLALALAWLLSLYWAFGALAFILSIRSTWYALAFIFLGVAVLLQDVLYARKKPL